MATIAVDLMNNRTLFAREPLFALLTISFIGPLLLVMIILLDLKPESGRNLKVELIPQDTWPSISAAFCHQLQINA
jgi:hypothetical protein